MRNNAIALIIIIVVIVIAALGISTTFNNTTNNTTNNNTTDNITLENNTTDNTTQTTQTAQKTDNGGSKSSEPSVVNTETKENYQAADGSHYKEVSYSDGNFRQYDSNGKLIGSSYESDQSKLPSME
ncbi:flagellar protein, FliL [Methanosphaera cuniculi]|uniref:flagellar protein, FliL n=1 Tax=Methanosphaera cuniculi TaxID=1077256 RepID=UPI0026F23EF9|nr:flagellar protein, FliL [Methanosphaera cuniculi]